MLFNVLSVFNTVGDTTKEILFGPVLEFLKNWWWLILPFALRKPFLYLWRWWRFERWLRVVFKPILFEIKIPKEILKPIRAMEDVMTSLHAIVYHPPDWWENWIEGQAQTSLGFEIVSIEGKIRFFVRVHKDYEEAVHAAIYSQYPDVEITAVDDYTKAVPQDIPNKDWDLWASDYVLLKADAYPILTYKKFETGEERKEEKRIDPMASLLESLARIGPGEQFWVQISASPVAEQAGTPKWDWIEKGKQLRNKLAKRESTTAGASQRPIVLDAIDFLISGQPPEELKKPEREYFFPPEMKLTPGEREIVAAVEEKISKPGFDTGIRFIYLAKRENFVKAKLRLAFTFFGSFKTEHLNTLVPYGKTLTKIHKSWFLPINLLRSRRMYLRQRKVFRNYVSRVGPFFPRGGGSFILNTEELASLFHFPSWIVAPVPGVARVEAKKKAPPELPKE